MYPLCERCRLTTHKGACEPDTYMPAHARHIFGEDELAAKAHATQKTTRQDEPTDLGVGE